MCLGLQSFILADQGAANGYAEEELGNLNENWLKHFGFIYLLSLDSVSRLDAEGVNDPSSTSLPLPLCSALSASERVSNLLTGLPAGIVLNKSILQHSVVNIPSLGR